MESSQTAPPQLKQKIRCITLLEVVIVILLVGLMAGVATFSTVDLLRRQSSAAAIDQFKELLEELQIEALALRSDMEVTLYKDKKGWKARSKTSEKILRSRTIELKGVRQIVFNQVPRESLTLDIFSTGRLSPAGILCLKRDTGDVSIDFQQPLQIKVIYANNKQSL